MVQRTSVPVHMLKEFLREGEDWNEDSNFDVKVMSAPGHCRAVDGTKKIWRDLNFLLTDQAWGGSFAIERGHLGIRARGRCDEWRWLGIDADLEIFRRLFEVRKEDLVKKLLSQNTQQMNQANLAVLHHRSFSNQ